MDWLKGLLRKKSPEFTVDEIGSLRLKNYILDQIGTKGPFNILEAGACGGEDTLQWASLDRVGHVYAFEPVSGSYNELLNKTAGNIKVTQYHKALSDCNGTTDIYISSNERNAKALSSSSSLLKPTGHLDAHSHIHFNTKEKVELITLDTWVASDSIERIDVMWLDMQGFEFNALLGGQKLLEGVQAVFTEVSLKQMYEGSILYPELKEQFASWGFEVRKEFLFWDDMGNVLFCRK